MVNIGIVVKKLYKILIKANSENDTMKEFNVINCKWLNKDIAKNHSLKVLKDTIKVLEVKK